MNNGTDINQLMKDVTNNKLTNEENSMVDSIISDLNTGEKEIPQQQKMPQITDEERNMLIKQDILIISGASRLLAEVDIFNFNIIGDDDVKKDILNKFTTVTGASAIG